MTFLNEVTEEYLFYTITFKATASGPIGTVEVSAAVRQNVSSTIKVENPLAAPVVFDVDCEVPDITVPPHFTVPAHSEVGAELSQCTLFSFSGSRCSLKVMVLCWPIWGCSPRVTTPTSPTC